MEFIDLKAQYKELYKDIHRNIDVVLRDAQFIGGKEVRLLEEKLACYVGRKYCITCANGTDALQLIYMAYNIGKNDAVFCPDMTFIASVEPACMLGATAVFCDIEQDTFNLSPVSLEQQIKSVLREGKKIPKAVVVVDFLGNPANYREIEEICKRYNLLLIEDAAQSMGGQIKEKKCGAFGDVACTSFFPSKPLGCYGDGGAVFTDDEKVAQIVRSLKVHGKGKDKYDNIRIGINSRLDTIQAGILLVKLDALDREMEMRKKAAHVYDIAFKEKIQIPYIENLHKSSYAQYCLLAKNEEERKRILQKMYENNIPSLIYYPNPLHTLKAFECNQDKIFHYAKEYASRNFGIPFSPYIKLEDQNKVIQVILEALEN